MITCSFLWLEALLFAFLWFEAPICAPTQSKTQHNFLCATRELWRVFGHPTAPLSAFLWFEAHLFAFLWFEAPICAPTQSNTQHNFLCATRELWRVFGHPTAPLSAFCGSKPFYLHFCGLRHLFVHQHKATHNTIFYVRQGNHGAFPSSVNLHVGGLKQFLCTKTTRHATPHGVNVHQCFN
jgi:hypothetical protein